MKAKPSIGSMTSPDQRNIVGKRVRVHLSRGENVFRLPGRNKQIAVKSLELALDLFLRDDPLDLID